MQSNIFLTTKPKTRFQLAVLRNRQEKELLEEFYNLVNRFKDMKTIEEAEKEVWVKDLDVTDFFRSGVEFAQRWILFENERPPQFEQVLVKCKGKGDKIYLSEYLGYGNGSFADTSSTVTHWRPIELK